MIIFVLVLTDTLQLSENACLFLQEACFIQLAQAAIAVKRWRRRLKEAISFYKIRTIKTCNLFQSLWSRYCIYDTTSKIHPA